LCSHEAITDVSLTGGREEFTGYLRERGIVRKDLICWGWVAPLRSHEAITDVSLTCGREGSWRLETGKLSVAMFVRRKSFDICTS
jgi:hypothetical protein